MHKELWIRVVAHTGIVSICTNMGRGAPEAYVVVAGASSIEVRLSIKPCRDNRNIHID